MEVLRRGVWEILLKKKLIFKKKRNFALGAIGNSFNFGNEEKLIVL